MNTEWNWGRCPIFSPILQKKRKLRTFPEPENPVVLLRISLVSTSFPPPAPDRDVSHERRARNITLCTPRPEMWGEGKRDKWAFSSWPTQPRARGSISGANVFFSFLSESMNTRYHHINSTDLEGLIKRTQGITNKQTPHIQLQKEIYRQQLHHKKNKNAVKINTVHFTQKNDLKLRGCFHPACSLLCSYRKRFWKICGKKTYCRV